MNKNFLKVLGLSALTGIIIDAVYRIGIKEGKDQVEQVINEEVNDMRKIFGIY